MNLCSCIVDSTLKKDKSCIFTLGPATADNINIGLSCLTQNDCGCPGQSVSYSCTVAGGETTLWAGTAFMCGGNEISLRHDQFEGAIGECNNGAITARLMVSKIIVTHLV